LFSGLNITWQVAGSSVADFSVNRQAAVCYVANFSVTGQLAVRFAVRFVTDFIVTAKSAKICNGF